MSSIEEIKKLQQQKKAERKIVGVSTSYKLDQDEIDGDVYLMLFASPEALFTCNSGILLITDPSYQRPRKGGIEGMLDAVGATEIENVLPGKWTTGVLCYYSPSYGERIAAVISWHAETGKRPPSKIPNEVGKVVVDSTFVGIFDATRFVPGHNERDRPGVYSENDTDASNTDPAFYPEGLVVKSGLGDGFFTVSTAANSDGKVIAVRVDFDTS